MQIIMIYTGDSDPKSKRNEKIFKRLYEEDTYTDDGKLKKVLQKLIRSIGICNLIKKIMIAECSLMKSRLQYIKVKLIN